MSQSPPPSSRSIDRQKTTPFLLHFCYRSNAFHNLADFPVATPSNPKPALPAHLQIYTWMSCTLRELAQLLTAALPGVVPEPAIGTRLVFRMIYPDMSRRAMNGRLGDEGQGRYMSREIGSVVISAPSETNDLKDTAEDWELDGEDSDRTLEDVRFVIGDYIDCAIFPPLSDGSVVPRAPARGGFVSGRGRVPHSSGRGPGASIPSGEWRRGERLPDSGIRGRGRGGPPRPSRY